MYLKGAVMHLKKLSSRQMYDTYRHDVVALWNAFKAHVSEPALGRFDGAITDLHPFESIRYPDAIVAKGMITTVVWDADDREQWETTGSMAPKYGVDVHQVDELMLRCILGCETLSANAPSRPVSFSLTVF